MGEEQGEGGGVEVLTREPDQSLLGEARDEVAVADKGGRVGDLGGGEGGRLGIGGGFPVDGPGSVGDPPAEAGGRVAVAAREGEVDLQARRAVEIDADLVVVGGTVVAGDADEDVVLAVAEAAVEGAVVEPVAAADVGAPRDDVLELAEVVVAAVVAIGDEARLGALAGGGGLLLAGGGGGAGAVEVEAEIPPGVLVDGAVEALAAEPELVHAEEDGVEVRGVGGRWAELLRGLPRGKAGSVALARPEADAGGRLDGGGAARERIQERVGVHLAGGRQGEQHDPEESQERSARHPGRVPGPGADRKSPRRPGLT